MERRINWFGLAAGIITLIVLAVSLFVPWWQLTIGDKLLQVNASPLNTNFGLLDLHFTIPLLWAWNLVSVLIFAAAGSSNAVLLDFPNKVLFERASWVLLQKTAVYSNIFLCWLSWLW